MADETGGHSMRIDGPTPNGGHHAVAHFSDAEGRPCSKDQAHRVEIVEHDEAGNATHRTYGTTGRSGGQS